MNRQIDEMAKIPESEMGMSGYSKFSWELWGKGLCNMAEAEKADQIMRNMGYRKASDVAMNIIEEIEKEINDALKSNYNVLPQLEESAELWSRVQGKIDALRGTGGFVEELKKKYESEDADYERED